MKKINWKLILKLLCFYIILFIFFKFGIVYLTDNFMNNDITNKSYGIGEVLNATKYNKEQIKETDYLKYKNFKIKNYIEDFELEDEDYNYKYYTNTNMDKNTALMIGIFPTRIDEINNYDKDSIYVELNHFPIYISKTSRNKYLEKHDIKNDVDLIKYIRSREKHKYNVFTPTTKIKEEYFYNFIEYNLPNLDKVYYIEGDRTGYIFVDDDMKQISIIDKDKLYVIRIYNLDYFNDEVIEDMINSIVIK